MTAPHATVARSVGTLLEDARHRLRAAPFSPSTREAVLLLAQVMGLPEVSVLAHPERQLDRSQEESFERLLERRLTGEPVAYLLGRREFYGRTFAVDARALIPRPETEHVVEAVLDLPLPSAPTVLDIGTGSGVIAVTLALELPGSRIVATDCSIAALALAGVNVRQLGVETSVVRLAADLTDPLSLAGFDLVVCNPPYISPADASSLSGQITHFEPHAALFAPPDGLGTVRRLLRGLTRMRAGTWLATEIGRGQQGDVLQAADDCGFAEERVVADYAGIPRVVVLRRR